MARREMLIHPSLGSLPARKVLDCIFAITPQHNILHYHVEQVSRAALPDEKECVTYTLTERPPDEARKRCCIIPPFVKDFGVAGNG